jgi:hypothetical protein
MRLFGSGSTRLPQGLREWNGLGEKALAEPPLTGAVLIGCDVLGGFFAVNARGFQGPEGNVFYFAPDALDWHDLGKNYRDFMKWIIEGNVAGFYEGRRWTGWEDETAALKSDVGFSVAPPLWASTVPMNNRTRKWTPMTTLWSEQMNIRRQILQSTAAPPPSLSPP